jgi:hypothetical protein
MINAYELDAELGYIPSVPLPYFEWQFWKWQSVRCGCGKKFITKDLKLVPFEYKKHYILNHIPCFEEQN